MKNDKSPGSNGLTKEFYVCFFNEVSNILITAVNHSFTTGMLSTSRRQALITLIEKKGKDKRFMKNWRPISLINVDTKKLHLKHLLLEWKTFQPVLFTVIKQHM